MPTATRSAVKRDPDAAGANATERQGEDDCAICFEPIDAASEVKLICGHRFHGQCAVRALLRDFGVADAAAADKQELAELVSEQLHYETDPDEDDVSDDDDE